MKRFILVIALLLIFGHILLEAGALYQIYKDYETIKVKPFLSARYHWYDPEGISVYHWLQMNCIEFLWCTTFFVLARVSYKYSYKLFLICCVFFLYHVVDYFLLWYDYKTSYLFYWFLNGAIIAAVGALFVPDKKKGNLVAFE